MMKAYLIAHPTYLTGASGNGNLPTNSQGYGMPDMETAFDATPRTLVDQTHVFDNTGETWTWDGTAADPTKPVRVVMTYTDAPGNTGSSPQVNNLDLAVTLGGNTYLGNRFSGQWSTPGGPADSANNYEAVFLPAGTSGPMNITITAANIAGDGIPNSGDGTDQDFALVCYNCAQDPGFTLTATPSSMELCAPDEATFAIDVGSILGFVSPATLSVSGTPAGTSAGFAPNPVTPPGTSTLTVGNTGAAAPGNYTLTLTGTATGGAPQSADIGLHLFASAPAGVALTSPAANATDVVLAPAFAWAAAAQASSYTIEVSGSSSFDSLITSASGLTSPAWIAGTTLSPNTTYYWRVRAENTCGSGTWSSTFSFTTGNPPFPQPYCDVSFPSNVEPITQVSFADINNSSSATINGTPALENFTHIIGHVEPGDSHVMTVKGNTAGNYSTPVKVYIDWNRDGTFANDANESYVIGTLTNSNGNDSKQVSAPIAIPATVTPGPVRMRVIKKWSTAADPCNNGGYGQAEDYTLLVTSGGSGPIIDVAPASLEASQPAGTLTTQVLVIENLGDSDLTWSIEEEPARPQPASLAFTGARGGHAGASDVAPRSNPTPQAAAIDEGFDDITALSGWLMNNHSDPLGSIDWFQGNDDVFSAFDGGDTAYIAANFNNAGSSGNIDNWLVTPIVNFEAVSTVSFYTRTADGTNWADRLEVRVCTSGACTDFGSGYGQVGEFTTVLLTVNESLDPTGYPQSWTQFTANLPNSGSGRIAFRYFVPDNDTNSNYIGIDRVVIDADGGSTPVCSNPDDVSWLDVNPGNGTTSSGAASNVNVEFDATGMTAGTYAANLCINSNDPLNNLVIVPVSMTVTEAVDITFTVTPSVGSGTGMISPDDPQTVDEGDVATFVLTPINDQIIHSVGGTCGGHLAGDTYTTDPVTTDCTVIAHFDDVAIFDDEFED